MRWFFDREDGLMKPRDGMSRRAFVFLTGGAFAAGSLALKWGLPDLSPPCFDVVWFNGNYVTTLPVGTAFGDPVDSVAKALYGEELMKMGRPGLSVRKMSISDRFRVIDAGLEGVAKGEEFLGWDPGWGKR